MKKFLFIFPVLLFLFSFQFVLALTNDVVISPSIIDEEVKIRDIFKYDISITNPSTRLITLYAFVTDVLPDDGEQEYTSPGNLEKTTSLAKWIQVKRGNIEVKPGEAIKIPLEINVDINAAPGKRYATITFSEGGNITKATENLEKSTQPRLMINYNVVDQIVDKAQIQKFESEKNIYFSWPVGFNVDIVNFGNREVEPKGRILIYNRKGNEVDELKLGSGEMLQPEENNVFKIEWNNGKGFGKFKAKVEVEYGVKEKRDLQDTIYFWVLPKMMIFLVIGTLFLVVFLLALAIFKKTYNHEHAGHEVKEDNNNGVLNLRNK